MDSRTSQSGVTTALVGGVLAAGLLGQTAARAQCVTPPSTFTTTVVESETVTSTSTVTTPGFQSLGAGSVNALTSVVSTLSAINSTVEAQGSSPFVVATPSQAPDQQGGGVWARGVGGSFRVSAPTNGISFDSFPTMNGTQSTAVGCGPSSVRQGFAGVQSGADVANLNLGGSGGTLHVGLTSGYVETSATTSDSLTNIHFQVPFFGGYASLTYGSFFADAQIRGNFFEGSIADAASNISGQKFNATGFTASGNAGYHYSLPDNWFIEPSLGINWSRTFVDPLNFSSSTTATTTTGGGPPVSSAALGLSNFSVNDFDSILGRASLRVGTTFVNGQYIFQPYFTASVFHEFASPIGSTVNTSLTGLPAPLPSSIFESTFFSTSRIGTYGQFGLGVAGQLANSGLTAFVRGDYQTGSRFQGWDVTGGARYQFDPERGPVIQARSADVAGAPLAPAPYNWSGFFLGASAPGALWGETKWSVAAGTAANNFAGVMAGGGGGYNYQMGALVVGGQAEWDWTNARGGESFNCSTNGGFLTNCNTRVGSIFTATARLGYAWDRLLIYGQGGLAVGDVKANIVSNSSFPGGGTLASDSKTAVGWTIGAGFEFGLTQNISAKAEYLYFDLGSDTYNLGVPVAIARTGNIGRVGLNYRFTGLGEAPAVVAKY
jgi:opacity protein-like surface antigen